MRVRDSLLQNKMKIIFLRPSTWVNTASFVLESLMKIENTFNLHILVKEWVLMRQPMCKLHKAAGPRLILQFSRTKKICLQYKHHVDLELPSPIWRRVFSTPFTFYKELSLTSATSVCMALSEAVTSFIPNVYLQVAKNSSGFSLESIRIAPNSVLRFSSLQAAVNRRGDQAILLNPNLPSFLQEHYDHLQLVY